MKSSRVLVADDKPNILNLLSRVLSDGFEVATVEELVRTSLKKS